MTDKIRQWEDPKEWLKRNRPTWALHIYPTKANTYSVKSPLAIGPGKHFPTLEDAIAYCNSIERTYEIKDKTIEVWE